MKYVRNLHESHESTGKSLAIRAGTWYVCVFCGEKQRHDGGSVANCCDKIEIFHPLIFGWLVCCVCVYVCNFKARFQWARCKECQPSIFSTPDDTMKIFFAPKIFGNVCVCICALKKKNFFSRTIYQINLQFENNIFTVCMVWCGVCLFVCMSGKMLHDSILWLCAFKKKIMRIFSKRMRKNRSQKSWCNTLKFRPPNSISLTLL